MSPTKRNRSKAESLSSISLILFCVAFAMLVFAPHETTSNTTFDRKDSEARQAMAHAEALRATWKQTSLQQAINEYERAALIWKSAGDFRNASEATLKSGDVYFLLSRYPEALKRYQEAQALARKKSDWLAEASALSQTARLYCYRGDNELAQKHMSEALDRFKRGEFDQTQAGRNTYGQALSNLGEIVYTKGNLKKALTYFEEARKFFEGDRNGQAKVHLFTAYITGSTGNIDKATAEIYRALDLYQAIGNKDGEGLALTALGLSQLFAKRENRALELYNRASEMFRSIGDRHSEAIALNGLGQAHENFGQYPTALSSYEQALRLFQDISARDGASEATCAIARTYHKNEEPDQALKYYERCLSLSRLAGKRRTEAYALSELANVYAAQNDHERASKQYERTQRFYESIGDVRGEAKLLDAYGEFLLRTGQKQKATDVYTRALPLSEKASDNEILITTLYNLARAHMELGTAEVALPFIQRSLTIIEDQRANVESPDFRVSYFSGVQQHYQLCIEILMELERRHPREGFSAQAFLVSEKSRARLLLDLVNESRADSSQRTANEVVEHEFELKGLLRAQARYRTELSLSKGDPAELAEIDKDLVQLRTEYQAVQTQLRQQSPHLFALEHSAPLDLSQIQRELRDSDTMLLEYNLGNERSYVWAITSNSFQCYEVPARKIVEDAAHEFYASITARQGTSALFGKGYQANVEAADGLFAEKAADLSRMLLGPFAEQLGSRRLLVVTDGALHLLPFEALPVPVAPGKLLIDTNEVVVLPSVSTLFASRSAPRHTTSTSKLLAVVADPVFSRNDDRVPSDAASSSIALAETEQNPSDSVPATRGSQTRDGFMRLVHASEEADAISAAAPWGTTMVAKGFDANRETVMSSGVGQYQIVHFATHGLLDSERPQLSGIVLTMVDRNGVTTNGLMPLHDIYNLDLSAELTVLSACQTALGKDVRGEGLVGLTHGFMAAGSKTVVASLWKVDDQATAVLMADFYEAMLQKGLSPSAALRSAKLKMMRDGRWSAPYYWAGFVLQGEYANHIAVDHHPWLRPRFVLLFLLILIGASLLVFQKRRRRLSTPQSA